MTTNGHTLGEVVKAVGRSRSRVQYIIRARNITPNARFGNYRLFGNEQIAIIKRELELREDQKQAIQRNENPVVKHLVSTDSKRAGTKEDIERFREIFEAFGSHPNFAAQIFLDGLTVAQATVLFNK